MTYINVLWDLSKYMEGINLEVHYPNVIYRQRMLEVEDLIHHVQRNLPRSEAVNRNPRRKECKQGLP